MRLINCLVLFLLPLSICAQNTVGLITYDPAQTYDGYSLIYPHNQPNVYLLDNCGEYVHKWEDSMVYRAGNTAYILDNGNLVKCKRHSNIGSDPIWAGGGGAIVEIRNWENDLLWSFELNDSTARLHHDIAMHPNGNIFMIAWENFSASTAIQEGRDSALLSTDEFWPDYIIEVKPIGTDSFQIVWEWHAMDHIIQDHDSTKNNFGVVGDHPELININYGSAGGNPDWMHSNSIDYNPLLDQILLSVPTFSEVWIIDHSTSTAQAASHSGGASGRGGDLVYRWGNQAAYDNGDTTDQKLFYQHDAHWVDRHLTAAHPDFGKVMVFNNRVSSSTSTVNMFNPVFDSYGWNYPMNGQIWGPNTFDYEYAATPSSAIYSDILSSAQVLENGNKLICVGRSGYNFELNSNDEIIWEFENPFIGGVPASQGDTIPLSANLMFQMKKYPADYSGFAGRDLSQKGFIEFNPDTTFCDQILAVEELVENNFLSIYPNPSSDYLIFKSEKVGLQRISVFNQKGQLFKKYDLRESLEIDCSKWSGGEYFIQLEGKQVYKVILIK
ncbi:MAG: T9SS type A sorting domain-containing protein [Chitinophagales bacterium]|nr:T9SS type A sorting domain-containing protein [Chitinophagales bacterium]